MTQTTTADDIAATEDTAATEAETDISVGMESAAVGTAPEVDAEPEAGTDPVVTMRQLLDAGVHFGHQTRRWNPRMRRFIHGEMSGIYILDLKTTMRGIEAAYKFVRETVAQGGTVLMVGTKKQVQKTIRSYAEKCGMPYVNERWLGGTLTNFATISKRVDKMREYQRMRESGEFAGMPKKEALRIQRELAKLERNLSGIGMITKVPDAVFVFDVKKEHIAVTEANKLQIPIIAVVDTNCDPDVIQYVIPGNDDAIRAGDLMCRIICDAVIEGKQVASARGITRAEVRTPKEEAEFKKQQDKARDEAAREAAAREARMAAGVATAEETDDTTSEETPESEATDAAAEKDAAVETDSATETSSDLEAWIAEDKGDSKESASDEATEDKEEATETAETNDSADSEASNS